MRRDLNLVVVCGAGAQQLGQDDWLTHCDEIDYPICRTWAAAIHAWEPEADGLIWRSKRDPGERVAVLWSDPELPAPIEPTKPPSSEPLLHGPAALRLKSFLVRWRLYIEP